MNPFPESIQIADYLRAHTAADARIAVIGSEPQIYFYAKRRAATSHLYMYGLMENHPFATEMQSELIAEVEAAKPEYLVYVNVSRSWLWRTDSNLALLDWYRGYARSYYDVVGVINLIAPWAPSRLAQPDLYVFEWAERFLREHYERVGVVQIRWPAEKYGRFCWDAPGAPCRPPPQRAGSRPLWLSIHEPRPDQS